VGAAAEDRLRPFFIETMLVEPVDTWQDPNTISPEQPVVKKIGH
jgi:hypothetical protein